jgi:hypothetical protein
VNSFWNSITIALAASAAFSNVPSCVLGFSFLSKWVQVQVSYGPYFRWSYFATGSVCIALSGLGFGLALQATWGKRFRMAAIAASFFLGLACMEVLANVGPQFDMAEANQKILGHADHSLSDWDDAHGRFPSSEDELREALAKRPLHEPAIYFRRGSPIPYDVQIVTNATGPSRAALPLNPGTVVYAVSSDYKEYWLTLTTLENPAVGPVAWEHIAGLRDLEPVWVMHRKHRYPGDGYQPFIE